MVTEASDCLHFFLSIARQLGINSDELHTYDDHIEGGTALVLTELIWAVGKISLSNEHAYKVKAFRGAWFIFWNLLEQRLQIYQDDLYQAYLDKNAENHKRQSTGY
ncbi:dUTPase [compost metagenome]